MQKVITITRDFHVPVDIRYHEMQYPELQKLFDEGYVVKEHILAVVSTNMHYAITFILEKK